MNKTEDPKQVRDMLVEAGDLMSYYHLQIALATLDRIIAGEAKYTIHIPSSDEVEREYNIFWKEIVEKDGVLDVEQVKKELYDFSRLLRNVSIVYCEITGGRMSKTSYDAIDVISEYNAYVEMLIENALSESAAPKPAPPPIDVEALKREQSYSIDFAPHKHGFVKGWNACIDNLSSKYDFVPKNHVPAVGKMVDVEALKREIAPIIWRDWDNLIDKEQNAITAIVDHLASAGYLRAPLPRIEGLAEGISATERANNAWVKSTGCEIPDTAKAVLRAARAYLKASGV